MASFQYNVLFCVFVCVRFQLFVNTKLDLCSIKCISNLLLLLLYYSLGNDSILLFHTFQLHSLIEILNTDNAFDLFAKPQNRSIESLILALKIVQSKKRERKRGKY